MSRSSSPSWRVDSWRHGAGLGERRPRTRRSRGGRAARRSLAAVRVRVRAHAPVAFGRERRELGDEACRSSSNSSRARSCASTPRASRGARRCRARSRAAPGASGRCPRPARRRRPSGPVQPLGVRSTIAGQRGRGRRERRRLDRRGSVVCASSSVAANCWCTSRGRRPRRSPRRSREPRSKPSTSSSLARPSTVGPLIL